MRKDAHAKINLGLDVIEKRQDGYHELNTLFCELCLHDEIDIEESTDADIILTGSDETLSYGPDNLAYRAAKAVLDEAGTEKGVKIHINKIIPMGAGLGGGSSDAAAVLKGVNELLDLKIDNERLKQIGTGLGADVPFFIEGGMAQATGIGEKLEHFKRVPLPPMLIIKPDVFISTQAAYGAVDECKEPFHPDIEKLIRGVKNRDYAAVCRYAGNTFENALFDRYPEVVRVKKMALEKGADACVMTGSGSALFAIFKTEQAAKNAMEALKNEEPDLKIFYEPGGTYEKE